MNYHRRLQGIIVGERTLPCPWWLSGFRLG